MTLRPISIRSLKGILVLLLACSLFVNVQTLASPASAQPLGTFSYRFAVDKDGFTMVEIIYRSSRASGSLWVFVPRFSEWTNNTVKGRVTEWSLRDTENLTDSRYYFYNVFSFSFKSDGPEFEMHVHFNLSMGAMMIEPNGIFYSPQIGFEKGNRLTAAVVFPYGSNVNSGEALIYGSLGSYRPSSTGSNSNYVLFDNIPETENLMRIEIGFRTINKTAELLTFKNGIFTFETVPRYSEYAKEVLDLYNKTYGYLVSLFNVTLEEAEVRFFLPDFMYLLSVGGYVPFSGEKMGDIHINIVFTRYVKGYIEVIALHELVHQFLWKAGISPQTLLWFHEGMAQYISIKTAGRMGYEGSEMIRQELENGILQLKQRVGENFGFLKQWSPSRQPEDIGPYYTAAYYVLSRIAEPRGGPEYYARFFKLMKGATVDGNSALAYYLSLSANESIVKTLNDWGFGISDVYLFSPLLGDVEKVLDEVNPVFQPYKFLAELLYKQALANASTSKMKVYLTAVILVARLAPLLTLITISGLLFGAILWVLYRKGVFSNP